MRNYHTHTFRCKHADGDVIDYAREAQKRGLSVLGMTDHTALPDDKWLGMRMAYSELVDYIEAIEQAQAEFPDLEILKGMECEWMPEYHAYFRDELLGEHEFDYLILGCHFFPYKGEWLSSHYQLTDADRLRSYTDFLITSMESGLFAFTAHPDLFGLSYLCWDENTVAASRDILSAAEELGMILEFNGYGLSKRIIDTPQGVRVAYPWQPFWEMAVDYDISVVVNSDSHSPEGVAFSVAEGMEKVKELGLKLADLDHLNRR